MSKKALWVQVSSPINASAVAIWNVLTQPELTEKYMYDCQLHSDWKIGSKAVWRAKSPNGGWVDHVEAVVLKVDPYKHLAFEIQHKSSDKNTKEVSILHFNINPISEGFELLIRQGDFNKISFGEDGYHKCEQGWNYVLPKLIQTCNLLKIKSDAFKEKNTH
jgi:uncharacterized protein YndB with AHSA1/START domain